MLSNALITGGSGMIGENINFGYKPKSKEMDVTNINSIKQYINQLPKISCIIHLVAINLRESEENHIKSINVNINGTINMLNIAMFYDIPFIFISTGAVFSSSNKSIVFDEKCKPNPNCIYGNTKWVAENISLLYNKTILIRTGWLFGGNQKNHYKFVELAINNLIINNEIKASNNFYGSPTYVIDLIEKIKYLIINNKYGIHHVVNDNIATGYDIGIEIASLMGKNKNLIIPVNKEDIPNAGPNRGNTESLDTLYEFNKMRSWKDSLKEYVEIYISNKYDENKINLNKPNSSENIWTDRTKCRLCDSFNLYTFFKLEPSPQANHFVSQPIIQELIPLDVSICQECNHIQLIQILNPSYQYLNYSYVSAASNTMVNHLTNSIDKFIGKYNIDKESNILEIGANDGTCIKHLLDKGYKNIVGIDPASNIHKRHKLPIICDFFNNKIIDKLQYNSFKIIYAFHCCAHIEDIQDVFSTIYKLLDHDGIFVMEVGYFYEVFKNKLFDTIYHEHIDFHTCSALKRFAEKNNLLLFDIDENSIQGGSICCFFTKLKSTIVSDNVFNTIKKENDIQLFNNINLTNWQKQIIQSGKDINYLLNSFILFGKKVAGYGASAKSTTFLHQYKLKKEMFEFIIDDSIYKQNYYTPGLHIPIKALNILDIEKIDYIIILSWNFTDDIIKKLEKYRINGLRIIIPFPEIKIL